MKLSRRELLSLICAPAVASEPGPIFLGVPPSKSGITWVHDNGRSEEHWLPESMCSGCAFFDYDNDGWMDILLLNTGRSDFRQPSVVPKHALYRNNRDGTFTDVTLQAGLVNGKWGEGVAIGDYNADGYPDIYLTCYGGNLLYRNNADGTFTDVTKSAGVGGAGWSTSALWFDYDNDGRLDLFVCNFVEYSAKTAVRCGDNALKKNYYCIPRAFEGRPACLYHNNGDGTFTEVGSRTAIGRSIGKAHGAVATDVNNDGLLDVFVANDTKPNFLFMNRGLGKFDEVAMQAGVAYGDNGQARSGMGVDAGDFDSDGRADLFVSNIDRERFSLYHNDSQERFTDVADAEGIGKATHFLSGWGLKFFDYDNDGNLDLMLANGHPDDMVEQYSKNVKWAEPLLLFHNDGRAWMDVSRTAGPEFARSWPARGLAVGDFDNDGGIDVLINNNGAAPLLLHNEIGRRNNWLGVRLVGTKANIDAIGARVTWGFGGTTRSCLKNGGGSYLSAHDPRLVLGIGSAPKLDFLEIRWPKPSTTVERFSRLPLNRYITLTEGRGL
jgi:hypothetical protein